MRTIYEAETEALRVAHRRAFAEWGIRTDHRGAFHRPDELRLWDIEYDKAIQSIIAEELQGARHG